MLIRDEFLDHVLASSYSMPIQCNASDSPRSLVARGPGGGGNGLGGGGEGHAFPKLVPVVTRLLLRALGIAPHMRELLANRMLVTSMEVQLTAYTVGREAVSWLFATSKYAMDLNVLHWRGSEPVNLLFERSRYASPVRMDHADGRLPLKEMLLMHR